MASPKRSRRVVEDVSEDEAENTRARARSRSSAPRTSRPNKRVRLSSVKEASTSPRRTVIDDDDDVDDDDDGESSSEAESDDAGGSDTADGFPQTQYELMRDNDFKHLNDIERDDELATLQLQQRSNQTVGNNMVAESGIIESIECVNFMCHERLHVEFGPLINFIVGENGSGKSAVLTALTLCLGGKASDTNRGGSLKSFVKEGRDQGTLIVKIKNAGSDAYKPEVYGRSIIIERHFSRSGASGFKVKSEQGKVLSHKKQDVDEISEWYALQMGNPLTVLSQDNARQFLNSASPAQKYKYFVSGVQLEQLDNDYKLSQDTLDQTLILQDDINEQIDGLRKEMEDAQRLSETAQKNRSLRDKLKLYRNQLVWAQVVEQERELDQLNIDLEKQNEELDRREKECETYTDALKECEEKLLRTQSDRDAMKDGGEVFVDKVQDAEEEWNKAKQEQTDLQLEERDAYSRLKSRRAEMQHLQSRIEAEEKRLGESTGSTRERKELEKSEASARVKGIQTEMEEAQAQRSTLRDSVKSASDALIKKADSRVKKHEEVLAAETAVRELRNSTGSAYEGFDKDIIDLAKAIKLDRGFEHTPLGPIGLHVKLRKPEWSGILEKTFGESLNAFVVRSKDDQDRLLALMRRRGMRKQPPIYTAYGGAIDTSAQEPDKRFDTILRVLDFDDEVVRSQLIINYTIEKIILIKDRVEAEGVMLDDKGPPPNVSACICFHDGHSKRGEGLRITNRNGVMGTTPVRPIQRRPRMQSEMRDQVAIQEENLRFLRSDFEAVKAEEEEARSLKARYESELRENKARGSELEQSLRGAQADVEQISTELDAFEGVDTRLIGLRDEKAAKALEVEETGLQYGAMKLKKKELMDQVELAKKKLDAAKVEQRDYQNRVSKADDKIKSCESLRKIAVAQKNSALEELDIERQNRRKNESRRNAAGKAVEEFAAQARDIAPDRVHIPEDETYASIEIKYAKLGEQLAQRERRLGATDQQIHDKAAEATKRYEDVVTKARDVDETVNILKQAIEQRLHLWRQFQRQISARVRIQFNYLLSERGFRGKIDLDHRAKRINIHIEPDQTRKSAAGRNTKTLSGGEKSFSSICMLLSVWEAIGSPIRCLDEFDVFMDNVNRAISTNMLVDAARRSVSRQYILITPNAIEGRAKLDKDVKIIRLTDPRQRTLV